MDLLRQCFGILFAAAIAAQLAAPVLAANAKTLALFCPSHQTVKHETAAHADRSGHRHDASAAAESHAQHSPDGANPSQQERKFFDVSCCSVHLTGIVSLPFASFALPAAQPLLAGAQDPDAVFPGTSDPPPRIFV